MKLSNEEYSILETFCYDNDIDFRTDYSGRCMYGKSCIGFVTDMNPFKLAMELSAFLAIEEMYDMVEEFSNTVVKQDNMGLSTIIYFPHIQVEETEKIED